MFLPDEFTYCDVLWYVQPQLSPHLTMLLSFYGLNWKHIAVTQHPEYGEFKITFRSLDNDKLAVIVSSGNSLELKMRPQFTYHYYGYIGSIKDVTSYHIDYIYN